MDTPEFSRLIRLEVIGTTPHDLAVEAGADERAALAKRFELIEIAQLRAKVTLVMRDGRAVAEGRWSGRATQACAVTGEPVPATFDAPLKLRFIDEGAAAPDNELEIAIDDYDDMPIIDGAIDLGEAVAQSLLLALDPYPRSPNAAETLRAAGVVQEGEEVRGAFSALKDLLK